ncbi:MAG: PEP-CTERM sorting domain-containing protein [Chthonomonadetes bacterium]|nr:PEP-CTERM sorting domain-containing protein [Chthonomonadetes bacterium]
MTAGLLKKLWRFALPGVLLLMTVGGSQAQTFTLTHNGWTYYEDVASQGWGSFTDPNNTNHMYQNWWWFRTNLDSKEKPLADLTSMMSGGATNVNLVFTEDAGSLQNALLFNLTYTLTGISSTMAKVDIAWSVRNIYGQQPQPITVNFFAYSDFDLNGSAGGDSGVLVDPQTIRYTEGTTAVDVTASSGSLQGYDVDNYPNLLNLLNDSAVYNVSNSGLPFGPGDMTNVFQWRATLGMGQQMTGTLTKLINLEHTPPPPPPPVIPEPGTWMLMLSGIVPVALRVRRKA